MAAYARGKLDARAEHGRAKVERAGEGLHEARERAAAGSAFAQMSLRALEQNVAEAFERFAVLWRLQRRAEAIFRWRKKSLPADRFVQKLGHRRRGYEAGRRQADSEES